ncbi:unnamed protein product [Rotaria sordida]|uniref:Uncharacterized protein n=1 Tax=Rotaria sordida TaxID=392033 RepID=A0A819LMI2_9BILA|nr:unnamed protein product [Rotaria sordida]
MDELLKQTIINELLEKIKAIQYNEIALTKLECEERKKILKAEDDYNKATEKKVNRDDLKIFENKMNFQKERTNLVVKAVEIFDNAKYSETTQAPEAAVPVEEVAPNEVEKKTEEVEPKKKEETQKKQLDQN